MANRLQKNVSAGLKALTFFIPYALVSAAAAIGLTYVIPRLKLDLQSAVNVSLLLPVKAGLVGVFAAALLAFWGFFWTEVIAESTEVDDLPYIVRSYRRSFGYFVPALLLLFASMGADFYSLLVNSGSNSSAAVSFGTFGAALFMLVLFLVDFTLRTLVQMQNLLGAGKPSTSSAKSNEHVGSGTSGA